MTHFPNVETERLYLRELTLADRQVVFEHFAEPDVTRFMDIEPCRDVKEAEEIIQFHIDDSGCRYGLFHKTDGEFIGTAGFHCWNQESPSKAEIGFDLSSSYWGQGLMQEALSAIIEIGWNKMNLDFIEATVEQANIQSQSLLEKLNFSKSTELVDNLFYYTLHKESVL
ncbi:MULTISPECIES: GNAT family N-acetyltransferase [unclassified Paenibacillus]|uniref:GNAT family N-acetyltransferase n=1 Tax=Paenibacillus TaxID=44249 RepID=UPI00278B31A9|nr:MULTISPECIES: GNAT family N-acetyltransferase [unclassified Paenibacillus]MDQ0721838.1 ribosomal-protein-alanine N-acetyltransferase [Paenibacillus sp. W4I10]MDR6715617.1 ribosomal-protein-alanine N-acetyltransferase [Paenibacillus sp. 2003]